MGLGPPICVPCRAPYTHYRYINEDGYECAAWYCLKCNKSDTKDYAWTISKELFEEIYGKEKIVEKIHRTFDDQEGRLKSPASK